jgi:plasmid maintenance system killer protein
MQEDLSEPGTCFITGLPILNYSRTPYGEGKHSINYSIKYNDNTHVFSFDEDCLQETLKVINENRDRVASIVLNGQMKLVYTHEENRLNMCLFYVHNILRNY